MIKPPFTVLILKNSRKPITVRITAGLLLAIFMIISIVCTLSVFFSSYVIIKYKTNTHDITTTDESGPGFVQFQPELSVPSTEPNIQAFKVNYHENGSMEIKFRFVQIEENNLMYLWLIVNPDAETVGERVVYPRSPLFRGLPVDYRNGIAYLHTEGEDITIPLSEEVVGITVKQFRILVFESEGTLVVDKYFSQQAKT